MEVWFHEDQLFLRRLNLLISKQTDTEKRRVKHNPLGERTINSLQAQVNP